MQNIIALGIGQAGDLQFERFFFFFFLSLKVGYGGEIKLY
jgi:hypothetical protein